MSQYTCFRCGSRFTNNNPWGSFNYCNVCQQTQAIEKQSELDREQQERFQKESRQAQLDQQQAEQDARYYAAVQAEERWGRIQAETQRMMQQMEEKRMKPEQVYTLGYSAIDDIINIPGIENTINLRINVDEDGLVKAWHDTPYQTPALYKKWREGLIQRLNEFPVVDRSYLLEQAKRVGTLIAKKELSTYFCMYTPITVNGKPVYTIGFRTTITETVDNDTGEVNLTWDKPFKDEGLNDAFKEGVFVAHQEINTPEKKYERVNFCKRKLELEKAESAKGIFVTTFAVLFVALSMFIIYNMVV